jgi:hypothetical protein
MILRTSQKFKSAAILGLLQFANWAICTVSWRATSQANIPVAIVTDFTLASFNFFLYRRIAKDVNEDAFLPWMAYTVGGVCGTVVGILGSKYVLGA